MAAASVSAVAEGLRVRLATISGLRTFAYQPEQLNPPFAYPVLTAINYHKGMGNGLVSMTWVINVVVGRYTDRTANTQLDGYLSYSGATSIRAALEGDLTLGGVVDNLVVPSGADIRSLSSGEAEFLQVQFQVTVYG